MISEIGGGVKIIMLVGTGSDMWFELSLPEDTEDLVHIEPGKLPEDVLAAYPDFKRGIDVDVILSKVYAISEDGTAWAMQVTII